MIVELNLVDENISLDGKKVIFVPFFFVFPTCFNGLTEFPSLNFISYSFPSLKICKSNFSDKAFTTDTPTPWRPPELYMSRDHFPPACSWSLFLGKLFSSEYRLVCPSIILNRDSII